MSKCDRDNYYQACKYVTRSDTAVYHSPAHPNLDDIAPPRTAGCVRSNRRRHGQKRNSSDEAGESSNANKITRLTNLEVSKFLEANNITTETELFAQAHSQKAAGKKDLANFLLSWFSEALNGIIANTCNMESAQQKLDRADIARMDIINNNALREYVPECQGIWIKCTNGVLQMNNVPVA